LKENNKFGLRIDVFLLSLFLVFSSFFAITYLSSETVFDAKIMYVNTEKLPYSVLLEVHKLVPEPLDVEIEIVYDKQNIVVSSDSFSCQYKQCEIKLPVKKIFYDTHSVIITTKYKKNIYKKELQFKFDKPASKNSISLQSPVFFEPGKEISLRGTLQLSHPGPVVLEAFSKKNPDEKMSYTFDCTSLVCPFTFPLSKNLIFGEYQLQVYLEDDVLSSSFHILEKGALKKGFVDKQKNNNKTLNLSEIISKKNPKLKTTTIIDALGFEKEVTVSNTSIPSKGVVSLGKEVGDLVKSEIPSLDSQSETSLKKQIEFLSAKSIDQAKSSATLKKTNPGILSSFSASQKLSQDLEINPVVYEDEKLFIRDSTTYIEFNSSENSSLNSHSLIPGVYKYQKIVRYKDGSEQVIEDYFAYGLISINTKKPLYHKNEVIDTIVVVLDKWGYLVENASIDLQITTPSNQTFIQSTSDGTIYETTKGGVYQSSFLASELGKYSLYAQVDLGDMVVDVSSYINVVESYPFDILRDVPATIDPWEGPFTNTFTIQPLEGYSGEYDFTEQFSSEIIVNETNADKQWVEGDTRYLQWVDLSKTSQPYYIAQTPLKTPYLYLLGKSYVDYNEGYQRFYENRSWQFAIDPAAKTCGFTSPCICGSSCNGGGEPGDGTIDTCTDGNTQWEFVQDIRVTNLNGTYFGTGDTVQICVDFDCDTSGQGDRVTIGYKGTTAAWANGDVVQEWRCDANSVVTHCVNQVLGNTPGTHFVRGKIVWAWNTEPANRICSGSTYRDHDDLEFTVLNKVPASQLQWDLDNGTTIGNNLNVIRGKNITAFAQWDKDLRSAVIEHNGDGTFKNYSISTIVSNYTNITLDTSNTSMFTSVGVVNVTGITSWDSYFNLSNITTPVKNFNIYATMAINQSSTNPYLSPSIIYNGSSTTMFCQVIDDVLGIPYSGRTVQFYHNVSGLLGTNTTNATGWAQFTFTENTIGNYAISCNAVEDTLNYYLSSSNNNATKTLYVKKNGTDIIPPSITSVFATPSLFSIGGTTSISANVTDNINLTTVYVNITLPNGTSYEYPMVETTPDIFEYNFSLTTQDGLYKYYIYAIDNSSNVGFSSTKTFQVVGIRTFIGIDTTKYIYKIGESINLTSYVKTQTIDTSTVTEIGDTGNILYTFDTADEWTAGGTGSEWARGVAAGSFVNQCDSGNCWATDLINNYNTNTNQWLESPAINFSGRTNVQVTYWRMLELQENGDDALFESWDGSTWGILFQDTTVPGNLYELFPGTTTVYPSEVEGVENAKFRFRLVTDGGGTSRDGWGVDTVNISFTPRTDWDKPFAYYTTSFGSDVSKVTAIKIGINVTGYSSTGSNSLGTASPDILIQVYNGTGYDGNYVCGLDSTKTYPYYCEIVIKNTAKYLDAWKTSANRSIRVQVIDLDTTDSVTYTDVKREYITPSILENHGIAKVTSNLLQQFLNSTGGVVQTMYNSPIELNASQTDQLSKYWSFSVPEGFTLGTYYAYVALTDAFGNVLVNEDDSTLIEDNVSFQIQSLLASFVNPTQLSIQNETFLANISLDTTYFGSGGWCGYSLNGGANVSMTQQSATSFDSLLSNVSDGSYTIQGFCNDTDGYMVKTPILNFTVSEPPRVSFIPPTDANASTVSRGWSIINVSIVDSSFNSSWLEWDGINYSISSCSFQSGITWHCSINKSDRNGLHQYRVCANDSLSTIGCSEYRQITFNRTLPVLTILSPLNGSKTFYGNATNFTVSSTQELSYLAFELNGNGTVFSMNNITTQLFERYLNLSTKQYSLVVYANDTFGNPVNVTGYFYVLPDKHVKISKVITFNGNSTYSTQTQITNLGTWQEHRFVSIEPFNFNISSQSLAPDWTRVFSLGRGFEFLRNISSTLEYNETFSATNDFSAASLYIVSLA
jgi:hypothetical protein